MKIKVCGKAHLEGVAKKTGRPYNFNQIHYLGKARGVIGEAALTIALDPDIYYVTEDPHSAFEKMLPQAYCCHFSDDLIYTDPLGVHTVGAPHGQGSMDCARMIRMIREKSPMDKIIMENEIAFRSIDEPIEEARTREMKACEESIAYLRGQLKLGVRNR